MRVFVLVLGLVCALAWFAFGNTKGERGLSEEDRYFVEVMKTQSTDSEIAELLESGEIIYHKIK